MITVVVVEDSQLARLELTTLLKAFPDVQVVAEADSVSSAVDAIETQQPDLAFVDIDLPGGDIFTVFQQLTVVPPLIFTTAFEQHALQAFNFDTVDYLLKPIKKARLAAAMEKYQARIPDNSDAPPLRANSRIFVKEGESCWLIKVQDILYIEAIGNYCRLHCADKAPMIYRSLSKLEERLSPIGFVRSNRSEMVNLEHVSGIEPWNSGALLLTLNNGKKIEVSRRQASKLKQQVAL